MTRSCLNCGHGELVHGSRDLTFEYQGALLTVPEVSGWHCPKCGETEFDEGEGERYWDAVEAFKSETAARRRAEIRRIRRKLKLTQAEAARLTGGGKNAFSRYERGEAEPMAAVVNLFRLLDKHPELLEELRGRSGK